jgi:ferredoxin
MGNLYKYIQVDRDLCIGAASCIAVYPEIFELDEESKAIMLKKDGKLLLAAQSCPTAAIFLYDEHGNLVYPE